MQALRTVDSERAGVDHTANVENPRRLEAVIHAQDVDPHLRMRVALGCPEDIGKVDHSIRLCRDQRLDHIVHHRDIAMRNLNLVSQRIKDRRARIDVHAVDLMSMLDQPSHDPWSDESTAA